jgi:hypothetical protein
MSKAGRPPAVDREHATRRERLLQDALDRTGMTRREAARAMRISPGVLSRSLRTRRPTPRTLARLRDFLVERGATVTTEDLREP